MTMNKSILEKHIRSFIRPTLWIAAVAYPLLSYSTDFTLKSKIYAGTYDGFAERLTITAGDIDGDGDPDIIGGFAQGGLVYLRNPEMHLSISPPSATLLSGESLGFSVPGHEGPLTWSFIRNSSEGNIGIADGTYASGAVPGGFDIIEARSDDGFYGRAYVNVIGLDDVGIAGKAIVVAGGKSLNDPLWPTSDYLADLAYNTLRYRGFSRENLEYLSFGPNNDVDGNGMQDDIDGFSDLASISNTLNNWAADANRLFIYLTDHGGDSSGAGYFRLNSGEVLTAVQLDIWLDALQDAGGMDVTVVIDCCYAGSFIDELAYAGAANRIVVASCSETELTYFLAGGLISFSDVFFHGLMQGFDIGVAYGLGADAMSGYQSAQLDDGGASLDETTVGASFIVGRDYPTIGNVSANQTLAGETHATLWASEISSSYPLERVWCSIIAPNHQPNTNAAIPVIDVPEVELSYNATLRRYESNIEGFSENGPYQINFYAEDVWGGVSYPRQGLVTQAGYDERLIIVAGGTTNDPQWTAVANVAATAYNTALARRLDKTSIRYLSAVASQDLDGDGTNDVETLSSLATLDESITIWATGADKLAICLLGSTSNGLYQMNASETLGAAQLDGWLDSFQSSDRSAIVMLDFDGSGSYIPSLAAPDGRERIVVASTRAGAPSVTAAEGFISFSHFFMSGIFNGQNLWDSFNGARLAIRIASGRVRQTPQLDDSGDGIANQKNLDGLVAVQRYLGAAFVTGDDSPFIGSIMPSQSVVSGASVPLWAADILDGAGISNVWCVITPPDYAGQGELPQTNLLWNTGSSRYEVVYTNFTKPGTYACTFYARNNDGLLSSPAQSEVTVTDVYEEDDAYEEDDTAALATIFRVNESQSHNFHSDTDEDWVKFYAPTGLVFTVDATQQGTNSDLVLDLYYELPDGSLELVDYIDDFGTGTNVTESLTLDLKVNPFELLDGVYYLRVGSYDTNFFGSGSEYELQIYVPVGVSSGVPWPPGPPGFSVPFGFGSYYVVLDPPQALAAGAGWRIVELENQPYYSDSAIYGLPAPATYHLNFFPIPGFLAPANQPLPLITDQTNSVMAYYTYTNLSPRAVSVEPGSNDVFKITYLGYAGMQYAIEESTNLIDWVSLSTNQIPLNGLLHLNITNAPSQNQGFYRARLNE